MQAAGGAVPSGAQRFRRLLVGTRARVCSKATAPFSSLPCCPTTLTNAPPSYTPRQVITHDQLASGFTRLLSSADDLLLDVPDALHLLSLFLGRAVVDELLPPAFLTQVRRRLAD